MDTENKKCTHECRIRNFIAKSKESAVTERESVKNKGSLNSCSVVSCKKKHIQALCCNQTLLGRARVRELASERERESERARVRERERERAS